jgi:hypothetical protein
VQPAGFAEGAAGFARVANNRGDRLAAREYAADDLSADAAGGADHCGGHRVSFRQSSISSAASRPGGRQLRHVFLDRNTRNCSQTGAMPETVTW